ncbi:MAG: hypothetical protein HY344_01720 [Candidatus Levybacteria bacterium]|nr:hypothetical protein [Candidatus Levybacteria bacterium]
MKTQRTFGLELEKPISSSISGQPHGVSAQFFIRLKQMAAKRKQNPHFHLSDVDNKTVIGVISKDLMEQGLDNGSNLQETALPYTTSIDKLFAKIELDLKTVQDSLKKENATIINFANHPLGKTDLKTYKKFVALKGIYPYIWYRGWNHAAGIDAKAQNSPTTGVNIDDAADAVSVIIGASAAFIGIFANSPFENGKRSNFKESRLSLWNEMMKNAKVEGDRRTVNFPNKRFHTLAQYFDWMFGQDSGIHFVLGEGNGQNYKGLGDRVLIIENSPPVLTYLSKKTWKARALKDVLEGITENVFIVKPNILHLEAMQFAQFTGARIRFGLKNDRFPLREFVMACKKQNKKDVEKIFNQFANFTYIEGRDAGANFADREILAAGEDIAKSVAISPSALQAGLINNLKEATSFIDSFNWNDLGKLRNEAIKNGLGGRYKNIKVYDYAKKIVEIAKKGLSASDQKYLLYIDWVLKTKKNGADRAIEFIEKQNMPFNKALLKLIKEREILL